MDVRVRKVPARNARGFLLPRCNPEQPMERLYEVEASCSKTGRHVCVKSCLGKFLPL